jgi:predicted RNA binding protein YcfA (HicA-like mRNA interferase family)
MAEYAKKVRDVLSKHGCYFLRHGKGDHDVWYSPEKAHSFPVAAKIKSRHTANEIMKQAGIDRHF